MYDFAVFIPKPKSKITPKEFLSQVHNENGGSGVNPLHGQIESEWTSSLVFKRLNGTAAKLYFDAAGCWAIVAGTCYFDGKIVDEVKLLEHYRVHGAVNLAQMLQGFFVIIIGDAKTKEVIVITDIIGSYHCYIRYLSDGLVISGSVLLLAGLAPVSINSLGCQEFVRLGVTYEGRTYFNEIHKLAGAKIYRFGQDHHEHKSVEYWSVASLADRQLSEVEAVEALWGEAITAMKMIGSGTSRLVSDLTGGYDSRILVATLDGAKQSFSTTVSGDDENPDVLIAGRLSAILHTQHSVWKRNPVVDASDFDQALALTDGLCDAVEYAHTMKVHTGLSRQYDMSLNGSFGEVARGYWWELLFPNIGARKEIDSEMLARKRFAAIDRGGALFCKNERIDMAQNFSNMINSVNSNLRGAANTLQMDNAYLSIRMQHWQGRIASSTNKIWPCLSPFMLRNILEVMLISPPSLRVRSGLVRRVLGVYHPTLAKQPLEHGYPAMPFTILTAPRFWRLVPYYSERVSRKVMSKFPGIFQTRKVTSDEAHRSNALGDELSARLVFSKIRDLKIFNEHEIDVLISGYRIAPMANQVLINRLLVVETVLSQLSKSHKI